MNTKFTVNVVCCVLQNIAVKYRENNVENSLINDFNGDDDNEDHIPQNVLPSVKHRGSVIHQHIVQTFAVNN